MRMGFVTCVQIGLSCIETIYECGGSLDLIVTLKDDQSRNKSGRIYVDKFADSHGVPVLKVSHINDESALNEFERLDWLFIIGWSQIAGREVVCAPKHGVLGMHPTLLPTGRGRAAIPWAILKGLSKTGVSMFKLDEGVDTGPVLAQVEIPLTPKITATNLYSLVNSAHMELIRQSLPGLLEGSVKFSHQDEALATVWPGRRPEDGAIDMSASVYDAERLVRAVTRPYPGAFYYDELGRKVIVWSGNVAHSQGNQRYLVFKDGYLVFRDWEYAV